jgi:pyruvate ferredoxin oxidoreductase alpha subunit
MPVVNRALSGPINIHNDHSDTMGARDTGWVQIFSENSQEAYDNTIQAFRVAEHKDILLPVMVTMDGFIISHTMETLEIITDDAKVKGFVGEYKPDRYLLDTARPFTFGPLDLQDYYFEHKRQQVEAMRKAQKVVEDIGREFGKFAGRPYGIYEGYKLEDAELVLVALGSTCGTIKVAIDEMRAKGKKVGLLKIRLFRPFPGPDFIKALTGAKKVGVMDKSASFGLEGGPVFHELRSFAYGQKAHYKSYIYGLGGRDITVEDIVDVFKDLEGSQPGGEMVKFVGVRE